MEYVLPQPLSITDLYDDEGHRRKDLNILVPTLEEQRREDTREILRHLSEHFFEYIQTKRKTKKGHGIKYTKRGLPENIRARIRSQQDRICEEAIKLSDATLVESVRLAIEYVLGKEALIVQRTRGKGKKEKKKGRT